MFINQKPMQRTNSSPRKSRCVRLQIEELEAAAKRRLKITRASASYLLAMKCLACRPELPGYRGDVDDIRFLIRKMDIRTLEQIEQHMDKFYPRDSLTPRARDVIQGLLPKEPESQ